MEDFPSTRALPARIFKGEHEAREGFGDHGLLSVSDDRSNIPMYRVTALEPLSNAYYR
jgi:hypothetical protein